MYVFIWIIVIIKNIITNSNRITDDILKHLQKKLFCEIT